MINGKKVLLRAIQKNDASKLLELHNNINIKEQAMFHPYNVSQEQELNWIDRISNDITNKSVYFAIEEIETREFAGYTSLRNINYVNLNCYFGIVLLPEKQGRGIGKEATELIIQFGFKNLNLHKINLEVNCENLNAINLYRKLGFIEEGNLKQQFYFNQRYYDVMLMAKFNS